jgi:hypothetical protein
MKIQVAILVVCMVSMQYANVIGADQILLRDSMEIETVTPPFISVAGAEVYSNDKLMSHQEVINMMQAFPDISSQYQAGYKLRKTGSLLLTVGIIGSVGGVVLMASGYEFNTSYDGSTTMELNSRYYAGLIVSSLFEPLIPAGIVCKVMGKNKIINSVGRYYRSAPVSPGQSKIHYEFGIFASGIGIRMTF